MIPPVTPRRQSAYLAGPMRGYDQFNFPAFDDAAALLRLYGWEVVSPAEHDRENGFDETKNSLDGFDLAAAFAWDLQQVCATDCVIVLPGWERSSGARIEAAVAQFLGHKVWAFPGGPAPGLLRPVPDGIDLEPQVTAEPYPANTAESILSEADRIVNGPRQAAYGHPANDFARTAALWTAIFGHPVTAEQVALAMICLKVSRLVNTPDHRDSAVDIAGYAQTLRMVVERGMSQPGCDMKPAGQPTEPAV